MAKYSYFLFDFAFINLITRDGTYCSIIKYDNVFRCHQIRLGWI